LNPKPQQVIQSTKSIRF